MKTSSDQICWTNADDVQAMRFKTFKDPSKNKKKCCEESIWSYPYDQDSEIYFIYEKNMKRKRKENNIERLDQISYFLQFLVLL